MTYPVLPNTDLEAVANEPHFREPQESDCVEVRFFISQSKNYMNFTETQLLCV